MTEAMLGRIQGFFFLASGIWPLVHRRSFEYCTGRKKDWWLVQTVGLLVTAIGASLLSASRKKEIPSEIKLLATTSSVFLMAIDIIYTARRRIKPTYLGDAAVEGLLVFAWLAGTKSVALSRSAQVFNRSIASSGISGLSVR